MQISSQNVDLLAQREHSLLGLVHGHFDIDLAVSDAAELDGKSTKAINSGLAIVVPSQSIKETLEQDHFKEERSEYLEKLHAALSAST